MGLIAMPPGDEMPPLVPPPATGTDARSFVPAYVVTNPALVILRTVKVVESAK